MEGPEIDSDEYIKVQRVIKAESIITLFLMLTGTSSLIIRLIINQLVYNKIMYLIALFMCGVFGLIARYKCKYWAAILNISGLLLLIISSVGTIILNCVSLLLFIENSNISCSEVNDQCVYITFTLCYLIGDALLSFTFIAVGGYFLYYANIFRKILQSGVHSLETI